MGDLGGVLELFGVNVWCNMCLSIWRNVHGSVFSIIVRAWLTWVLVCFGLQNCLLVPSKSEVSRIQEFYTILSVTGLSVLLNQLVGAATSHLENRYRECFRTLMLLGSNSVPGWLSNINTLYCLRCVHIELDWWLLDWSSVSNVNYSAL